LKLKDEHEALYGKFIQLVIIGHRIWKGTKRISRRVVDIMIYVLVCWVTPAENSIRARRHPPILLRARRQVTNPDDAVNISYPGFRRRTRAPIDAQELDLKRKKRNPSTEHVSTLNSYVEQPVATWQQANKPVRRHFIVDLVKFHLDWLCCVTRNSAGILSE
jgi:hypothetical protein